MTETQEIVIKTKKSIWTRIDEHLNISVISYILGFIYGTLQNPRDFIEKPIGTFSGGNLYGFFTGWMAKGTNESLPKWLQPIFKYTLLLCIGTKIYDAYKKITQAKICHCDT